MRVLLYSDAMNPELSSEPGFIFNIARAIVDHVDEVVVATQIRNKEAIDRIDMGHAKVVYLDTEYIARPIWRLSSILRFNAANLTAVKYPVQCAFEYALWKHFKDELDNNTFDIVHRIGPISSALPSPLASWTKTPFVIGPVNGGLPYPENFRDVMRKEGEWLRYVRGLYTALPYVKSTYTNASAILAAFQHTIERLPIKDTGRIFNIPEIAADPNVFSDTDNPQKSPDEKLDFLFVGRLVPFKCVDVVVRAFAQSEILRKHRLIIAGDGPDRPLLEALITEHNLQDCVKLLGWTEKTAVADYMKSSDVFVFPSVRDSGGGVIAEAMVAGLPPVVVGYGPGLELVDSDSGVLVPLGKRQDHVDGFQKAMETLAGDETRRKNMGAAAQKRAMSCLTWDARAKRIVEIYRWCVDGKTEKPRDMMQL